MSEQSTTFIPAGAVAAIGPKEIAALKAQAMASPLGRARICLHADHADPVQEMVIALRRGAPVSAIRQQARLRKSYHLLEGELRVVFFDEAGTPVRECVLGAGEGQARLLTFPAGLWQACEALTPIAIYHEAIAGPFDPGLASRQPWVP